MNEPPEEQVRQLVAAYQQYQAEADALVRQLGLTQITMEELDKAVSSVDALDKAEVGQEILVPIGSGSYVYATLKSKEKVVLNIGAGVSVEKSGPEAKEILKVRRSDVGEGSKKLTDMLGRIEQEMSKIQSLLEGYQAGSGNVVQ